MPRRRPAAIPCGRHSLRMRRMGKDGPRRRPAAPCPPPAAAR